MDDKSSLKWAWLGHVNRLNFGGHGDTKYICRVSQTVEVRKGSYFRLSVFSARYLKN